MNDIVSREILGAPVIVTIGKREHPLSYPAHNLFLYRQLTGDSLFKLDNWHKIDFEENYENWISCLWAGLHAQQPVADRAEAVEWKAPYTRAELEQLIGFANAPALHRAMVDALTAWMPKKKESEPAAPLAVESQPAETRPTTISEDSGSALAVASD